MKQKNSDIINDVEVVNVVGAGEIDRNVDLDALSDDLPGKVYGEDVDYPGLFQDYNGATNTIYRSGSFTVRDGDKDSFRESKDSLLQTFEELGLIDDADMDTGFEIENVVVSAKIDSDVRLSSMSVALGLEHTEYSPEQFPALVYRRKKYPCTFLLFQTGAIIATGGKVVEKTHNSVYYFVDELREYLNPTETVF